MEALGRADTADDNLSRMEPDSDPEFGEIHRIKTLPNPGAELASDVRNSHGGAKGSFGVIVVGGRRSKEGHHRIADKLVYGAALLKDRLTDPAEVGIEQIHHLVRSELL